MNCSTVAFGCILVILVSGCGLRFSGGPLDNPFPPEIKTIFVQSAVNQTVVTGIETELTNGLRGEFALGSVLSQVAEGGDCVLKTEIVSYEDNPSTYRNDGKELTRIGTLRVRWKLERTGADKPLRQKDLAASNSYNVTDTISGTLTNRREAVSRMINDLIPRIHRSLYDNF